MTLGLEGANTGEWTYNGWKHFYLYFPPLNIGIGQADAVIIVLIIFRD